MNRLPLVKPIATIPEESNCVSVSTVWLFQLAVSKAVIPLAMDAPKIGSVSV